MSVHCTNVSTFTQYPINMTLIERYSKQFQSPGVNTIEWDLSQNYTYPGLFLNNYSQSDRFTVVVTNWETVMSTKSDQEIANWLVDLVGANERWPRVHWVLDFYQGNMYSRFQNIINTYDIPIVYGIMRWSN